MGEKFISIRETAQILGVCEKKVLDIAEAGKIPAYRIAGQFLRFKENEIIDIRNKGLVASDDNSYPYTPKEQLRDFFSYNDFYLASVVVILCLLAVILFS